MLEAEFTKRTGFYPTDKQYRRIEKAYMESNLEKDEFCLQWKYKEMAEYSKEQQMLAVELNDKLQKVGDIIRDMCSHLDKWDELDTPEKRRNEIHKIYLQFKEVNGGYDRVNTI